MQSTTHIAVSQESMRMEAFPSTNKYFKNDHISRQPCSIQIYTIALIIKLQILLNFQQKCNRCDSNEAPRRCFKISKIAKKYCLSLSQIILIISFLLRYHGRESFFKFSKFVIQARVNRNVGTNLNRIFPDGNYLSTCSKFNDSSN